MTPDLSTGGTSGTELGSNSWDALGAEKVVGDSITANAISLMQQMRRLFADAGPHVLKRLGGCIA